MALGEGNKFAMEAMKALLLLNGGGAHALLTFFGTRGKMTAVTADAIGNALLSFGVGTVGRRLHFRAGLLDATALRQLRFQRSGPMVALLRCSGCERWK